MKLTEQQLQKLFQDNTFSNQADVTAGDCLTCDDASSQRLQQAEALLNDFTSAQTMKVTFALKDWSAQIAKSVDNQSVSSWFNWISHPFKTTVTACAFAMVLSVAIPNLSNKEQQFMPTQVQSDVISVTPFESDVLSSGSFDNNNTNNNSSDSLFNGSFG